MPFWKTALLCSISLCTLMPARGGASAPTSSPPRTTAANAVAANAVAANATANAVAANAPANAVAANATANAVEPNAVAANAVAANAIAANTSQPATLVTVSLLADTAQVRPGEPFTAGVRFQMAPGWHIYWLNPGDSGLPTTAKLSGPDGFRFGPLRLPGPERFTASGDLVSYGYAGETIFFSEVTPPAGLAPGTKVKIAVDAKWLACQESCVRGGGRAELELPVAARGGTSKAQPAGSSQAQRFAPHQARLPRAWSTLEGATVQWSAGATPTAATVRVPGATDLELFPGPDAPIEIVRQAVEPASGGKQLKLELRAGTTAGARPALQGVLRVQRGGRVSYYDLNAAAPAVSQGAGTRPR